MDLRFGDEEIAFRTEVRDWVARHLPEALRHKVAGSLRLTREDIQGWARTLGTQGWLAYRWPKAFGGPGWSAVQQHLFEEACAMAGAPRIVPFGPFMVAPVAEAEHAGIVICRSLAPVELLPDDIPNDRLRFVDGWGDSPVATHVLICPVRGGAFVAIDTLLHGNDLLDDADHWNVPLDRLYRRLPADAHPAIVKMLENSIGPTVAHALYDRPVATQWSGQRVTIVGDAAHAMRPTMGQGACQALHDAAELSRQLVAQPEVGAALEAYESVRLTYLTNLVEVTRKIKVDPKAWNSKAKAA